MTNQQFDEEAIFHIARKLDDPSDRSSYLDQICAGDMSLRHRVETLLKVHEQEQEFLQSSADEPQLTVNHSPVTEQPGNIIGRYRLMEQIGEGGMGVVFVAEQERPVRRKVALKIVKPGMDTKEVIARFEVERQALALMDHANIAKVLDAGSTESGRPYFVMELVRGIPITTYCDENKLTVRERLELFIQVCQAVQHAHQKGIIHRDLKPANVLISLHDGKPVPKVIDFGVAKALNQRLTERTIYTRFAQIIGTPLYMSPEQAELSGLDIDTRSDIYSLGVLLYELLTGTTPFDKERFEKAAYDEIRRIIRETDPPKPSTKISGLGNTATSVSTQRKTDPQKLHQQVRGDLDWIVMKALEKDRTRRYETATDLAKDIANHLKDDLVTARPPSLAYRLRKFSKRHRGKLITTALVAASLLIGLGAAIQQAYLARRAAKRAEDERNVAEAESNRANAILGDLNAALFDQALTDILSGESESAREIIGQLRWQGEEHLADKLEAMLLLDGDPEGALRLFTKIRRRHPDDPGSLAAQMFGYNATANFKEFYATQWELEELLKKASPKYSADCYFVAAALALDSRTGLKHAERALRSTRSPVPLLWVGRLRSDYALHVGIPEEARRAIKEVEAAKILLGDTRHVRIDGLAAYLLAANAMMACGLHDEWRSALLEAEAFAGEPPEDRELLIWERFYLAEYYYEREQKSRARSILEARHEHGWGDLDTYYLLALANELHTGHEGLARGDRIGPFARAGMAITACLQGRRNEVVEDAERLLDEYDHPEVVVAALDALVVAGISVEELDRLVAKKMAILETMDLSTHSRKIVNRIITIYGGKFDEAELLHWSETSQYRKLWLTYVHWAIGMRYLADDDYTKAEDHFRQVREQRIINLGQYLWARAFLERWDDLPACRGAVVKPPAKNVTAQIDISSD